MKKTAPLPRQHWIDYARGIAIILVVYRHAFEGLKSTAAIRGWGANEQWAPYLEWANILFYSFRMPLFFIVAGMFIGSSLAKRGLQQFADSKARTILYPYFLWGAIQITVQLAMGAYTNGQAGAGHYLYLLYAPREIAQFWYLLALFNVTVLYAVVKTKWRLTAAHQLVLGLLMFAVSTLFARQGIEAGFITDVLHYYLFVAIGEAIAQSATEGRLHRFISNKKSVWLLVLPFMAAQVYFLKVNWEHRDVSPKFLYVEQYLALQYLGIALLGCVFVACVSAQLERQGWAGWLLYAGRQSLYIYVLHVMAFAAVRIVCIKVLHLYSMPLLLVACITGGVALPLAVYEVVKRLGWQALFTLEKEKLSKRAPAVAPAEATA